MLQCEQRSQYVMAIYATIIILYVTTVMATLTASMYVYAVQP